MNRTTLAQRISLVFAVLLVACCGITAWIQIAANGRHEQEVVQRLSGGLAAHIAGNSQLMVKDGLNQTAVHELFDQLMAVNPSVEVYLLDNEGKIRSNAAPAGHLKRDRVSLDPIRKLLAGGTLPIEGDDPRSIGERKVFSVAPVKVDGKNAGFVYVILLGEDHDALAASANNERILRTTLWSMGLAALLCLIAGIFAFHVVTRPLRQLTGAVDKFRRDGIASLEMVASSLPDKSKGGQEISKLIDAFEQMATHISMQWRELTGRDQQRRELFANVSHDLRTPLTSLHGYLETLVLKDGSLSPEDRRRYLEIAIGQSRKVGRLAQELFELARLEYGVVKPDKETFALPDLVQDVFQKFELGAESRRQQLKAVIAPGLPGVTADLGMIERVLTNLLDNAIRHTPEGGEITVELKHAPSGVQIEVRDTGPGIPAMFHEAIFKRPAFPATNGRGGLGLIIVHRILQLHESEIALLKPSETGSQGAAFRFELRP